MCVPVLKFIEETVRVFRKPVKMWQEGSKELRSLAGEAKYMAVFNEFMHGIELNKRPQNGRKYIKFINNNKNLFKSYYSHNLLIIYVINKISIYLIPYALG